MKASLVKLVWRRARNSCEYCRMPQQFDPLPFQIDHVVAAKHSGETKSANLALSCLSCNLRKGPNIAGIDPRTDLVVRLFHPRRDVWDDHFIWDGPRLVGRTVVGEVTIDVLGINRSDRVELRIALIAARLFHSRRPD